MRLGCRFKARPLTQTGKGRAKNKPQTTAPVLRDTDILVTQTAKGIQVVTDVTWLRVGPWSLCYGSKRREGSLSSVAGPLGRFPGFTQARSANLKTLSAPCQKQGTKQEGDLLG